MIKILLPFFMCALLGAGCSDNKIYLTFHYQKNLALTYRLSAEMKANISDSLGQRQYSSAAALRVRQAVTQVYPNGDAACAVTVDSVSCTQDLLSPAESEDLVRSLKQSRLSVKLSPYGDFLEVENETALPAISLAGIDLGRMLLKLYPVLPHTWVPVGGEWDREQQIPVENALSSGTLYLKKHFKLLAVEQYRNTACAKIAVNMLVSVASKDGSPFSLAPQGGELGKGSGMLYFALQEGRIVDGVADLESKMDASLVDPRSGKKVVVPMVLQQHLHAELVE